MVKLQSVLVAALIAFGVVQQFRIGQANLATEAARVRGDSIAADLAIKRIQDDSVWTVAVARETNRLEQVILNGDYARKALVDELADANVRLDLLAEVVTSATGEIISLGERQEQHAPTATCEVDDTWGGELDDGLLTGSWAFELPKAEHRLAYEVVIPGELILSTTADGRQLVAARALHERASFEIGDLIFEPPDPIVETHLSMTAALIAGLLGAIGWELVR